MGFNSGFEIGVHDVVKVQNPTNVQNGLVAMVVAALYIYYISRTRVERNKNLECKKDARIIQGPGNYFLGGLDNIYALKNFTKYFEVFNNWSKKYGSVYRINFGLYKVFALNSPEYVQKLLGSTDSNYFGKGFVYKPFQPYLNDGLICSKGEKWKFRRRLMEKHMFSFKTLFSYMKIFNMAGDTLVTAIEELFSDGKEKGIEQLLLSTALETITYAAYGKNIAELRSLSKVELSYTHSVNQAKEMIVKRILEPWLFIDFIWKLHPMSKQEKIITECGRKYALASLVNSSTQPLKNHGIGINQELIDAGVPLEGVIEEGLTLITAGYDTTANTLHFLLFFLALHPQHQEICREEVDSLFEDVDLCPSGFIQYRALSKLQHLEMCMNETLRLLPTLFTIMRRIDAPLQLEDDLELPAGSDLLVYIPGLHKNPKYFPDPDKFIPERFSPEQIKTRHPYAFIPFAAGPRKCIGHKFAIMEVMSFAAKLLRSFEWETKDRMEDLVLLPHITLTPQKPMKFLFRKRGTKNPHDDQIIHGLG